ncbi:hypothetical protein ACF3MZ_24725 [Paenibacillaceae bacterium WGS1546]|uniref:hypothetical protein n=1 Tax=Cohnella sp. WGS1546 TaxID=3366810 RepID=UPI00372D11D1
MKLWMALFIILFLTACSVNDTKYTGYGVAYSDIDGILFVETTASAENRKSDRRELVWLRDLDENDLGSRLEISLGRAKDTSYPAKAELKMKKVLHSQKEKEAILKGLNFLREQNPAQLFQINNVSAESQGKWHIEFESIENTIVIKLQISSSDIRVVN